MRLTPQTSFDGLSHRMVEFEHGEYVRYADYHALLEALKTCRCRAIEWGAPAIYWCTQHREEMAAIDEAIAKAESL